MKEEFIKDYSEILLKMPEGKYKDYLSTHRSEFLLWYINRGLEYPLGDFFAEQGVWKPDEEIPSFFLQ